MEEALCTTFIVEASRDALDTESRNPRPEKKGAL